MFVMKRIISILLIMTILLSVLSFSAFADETTTTEGTTGVTDPSEPSESTDPSEPSEPSEPTEPSEPAEPDPDAPLMASAECLRILKLCEGFSKKPYWDFAQYTVGYGTRCPDDKVSYYTQHGITPEEAELLLQNHLRLIEKDIREQIVEKYALEMSQNQFDALILFSFNCGTGWAFDTNGTFHRAIVTGATGNELIRSFALWCSAGGEVRTYLLKRRLSEANMYLNNIYDQTPPENYGYVRYDANGGTAASRSQGYDANLATAPYPTATRTGYTFLGWYTAKVGGEKVTVLGTSHKGMTLYAQWGDKDGTPLPEDFVLVTVTGGSVNIRKGPGLNYGNAGSAKQGDKLEIYETKEASGYTWGKTDKGWIALEFTNYAEVTGKLPVIPNEPGTKLYGAVNVTTSLFVRSGPGTSYSVVGSLKAKEIVEILERVKVGKEEWAKIADGWVSMTYIVLIKTEEPTEPTEPATKPTEPTEPATKPTEPPTEPTEPPVLKQWTGKIAPNAFLRVRSGPGMSYSVAGYISSGTSVTITEQVVGTTGTWGKIENGWISMEYVILDEAKEITVATIQVADWLWVRTEANGAAKTYGKLQNGDRVTILEEKTVNGVKWGRVSGGWICLDYAKLATGSDVHPTTERTVTASCLNVRSGAGTGNSVTGYLYYNTKVEILEIKTLSDGSQWGRTLIGWISLNYTK